MKAIEIIWKAVGITNIIADTMMLREKTNVYSFMPTACPVSESSRNTMKQMRQLNELAKKCMYNGKIPREKFGIHKTFTPDKRTKQKALGHTKRKKETHLLSNP